ncbi:GGDEF domain-containing protein [uncultured Pseudodesulfovibrio sp.]|uniref:GGDEF domain-containing protein n=1 Tax=uncultured Pseudodesulfovibrio sp. TaxID=2035858 RepID=UPI0029C63D97|nr:GGDEF domain-containing protein [uncultured Pseudodesulfovibrio sp.]
MGPQSSHSDMQHLAAILKKFGVDDPDWVAVILFVRNLLGRLTVYSEEKKGEIQREVFAELAKKDFSETGFETIIAMLDMYIMQTIGTLELEESLAQEKRSAAQLLNEMTEIIDSMQGSADRQNRKLDAFKEQTVGVIESGKERSFIVAKVRDMFQDLIVEFKEEARELQAKAKLLEHTANFDPMLTELHNRRALDAFLLDVMRDQDENSAPLSMMMIDVDFFKDVNDTYGHQAGDDVLRALSRIISAHAIQYQGFTARYGGEEIVIVMQDMKRNIAAIKAEAIRSDVENYDFRIRTDGKLADTPIQFTVSIGVSAWQPGWGAGEFVHAADTALYAAKNSGRNKVSVFKEE